MTNFRRSERYRFRLQVVFKSAYGSQRALTEDVSFHGVFIRTDESRAPNQLVKFTILDPEGGEAIDLLGIVARAVEPTEAQAERPPGIGVSLFGNSRAVESRWVKLVRRVKAWSDKGHLEPPPMETESSFTPLPARSMETLTQKPPLSGIHKRPTPPPVAESPRSRVISVPPPSAERKSMPPLPRRPHHDSAPPAAVMQRKATPAPPATTPPAATPPPVVSAPPPTEPSMPPPAVAEAPVATPVDAVKRAHVRRPARFNVTLRPDGVAALAQFELRDISEGGTFVLTNELLPVGSRINLRLIHPTSGEAFAIQGQIVRAIDSLDPTEKGIGIRFQTDSIDRTSWETFVRKNAPVPEPPPPSIEVVPEVKVRRTPPPVLMAPGEAPPLVSGSDPGGAPILLDREETPVPVFLGEGVSHSPVPGATPPPLPPEALK